MTVDAPDRARDEDALGIGTGDEWLGAGDA